VKLKWNGKRCASVALENAQRADGSARPALN
jgi:hypothetical protein